MKNLLTKLLLCALTMLVCRSVYAQSADSVALKPAESDSADMRAIVTSVTNSPPPPIPELVSTAVTPTFFSVVQIPTCSRLHKKDGLFYLDDDSVPYCGTCVALYGDSKPDSVTCHLGVTYPEKPSEFLCDTGQSIKIISHYMHGKRNGLRQYFDQHGRLLKTELYYYGKLTGTI